MKDKRIIANIILPCLMFTSIPLIVSSSMYQVGICLVLVSVIASFVVILRDKKARRQLLTYLALTAWLFIPLSFLLQLDIFGTGLDGLSNWAKTSVVVGLFAIAITGAQLFRVNR